MKHDTSLALVFDIGAHHGNRTHRFLELGATCVVSVEPLFSNFLVLRERFRHEPRVIPVHAACVSAAGEFVDLYACEKDPALSTLMPQVWSKMYPQHAFGSVEFVPTVTVESLAEKFGAPTYVKIDVEGAEGLVIAGMGSAAPAVLSFEFHVEHLERTVDNLRALHAIGYAAAAYSTDELDPNFINRPGPLSLDGLVGVLERERPAWGNIIVR